MLKVTIFGTRRDDPIVLQTYDILSEKLTNTGWNVFYSEDFKTLSLRNIQNIIQNSDAFVFMPVSNLDSIFNAISIFVGYQTLDPFLKNKPAVIINSDNSWDLMFSLFDGLQSSGTIRQSYKKYLLEVNTPSEALECLSNVTKTGVPSVGRKKIHSKHASSFETDLPKNIEKVVCIFCSASIRDESYIKDGYSLGKSLAENNFGCVSGAGTIGVMGSVVAGSVDAGGWTAGSNVPHIIEIEGLPNGLSSFWLRPDIYTRMEVMIEKSDAFIIYPGGAGTIQELLALLIFKRSGSSLMRGKPILIYNRIDANTEIPFWGKLIIFLQGLCDLEYYTVVDEFEEIIPSLKEAFESS